MMCMFWKNEGMESQSVAVLEYRSPLDVVVLLLITNAAVINSNP
jgi:hypothetical protein